MLPALAAEGLVDAVDAFCEGIAFTPEQVSRVFAAAEALGPLRVKLHADRRLFQGNTAPYPQNAYVRIRAIFRKLEGELPIPCSWKRPKNAPSR